MFPGVRSALSRLSSARSFQLVAESPKSKKRESDFHDKFGLPVLLSGASFCLLTWTYLLTHLDMDRYLSPVGRVKPKEWRKL